MLLRAIQSIRDFNPQAKLFFAGLFGLCFVVDGVYNVLLNLFLLRMDYGTEFIGLVNAAGLLTFAFSSLIAGVGGSRISNTALMKAGAIASLFGALLLPQVIWVPAGWRETWLVAHVTIMFGGFSFFFVNGAAYLINVVDTARKHHAFALKTAHWAMAAFFGSLVGGILPGHIAGLQGSTLADPEPYRLTLSLTSAVLALAVLIVLRIRPLPKGKPQAAAEAGTDADGANMGWTTALFMLIVVMTLIRLFQVAGSATALVYFNVYMDRELAISTAMIGGIAALGRLTGVPTALITPRLVRRWGNINVVIWSSLAASLFLIPLALVEHWLPAAIGFIGSVSLMSVRYTAFIVYILDLVPKGKQALMAGAGEMAAGLSFAMMAMGGGLMLSVFTFRDLFLLGSLFSFFGTALFWLYVLVAKPKRKLQPAL